MEKISLTLKNNDSKCDVFAGQDLFGSILNYLKNLNKAQNVIITDSKVKELHGNRLLKFLNLEYYQPIYS